MLSNAAVQRVCIFFNHAIHNSVLFWLWITAHTILLDRFAHLLVLNLHSRLPFSVPRCPRSRWVGFVQRTRHTPNPPWRNTVPNPLSFLSRASPLFLFQGPTASSRPRKTLRLGKLRRKHLRFFFPTKPGVGWFFKTIGLGSADLDGECGPTPLRVRKLEDSWCLGGLHIFEDSLGLHCDVQTQPLCKGAGFSSRLTDSSDSSARCVSLSSSILMITLSSTAKHRKWITRRNFMRRPNLLLYKTHCSSDWI